jgi:hypothetical protein
VINIEEKIPVRNVLKYGSLNLLEPSGPVKACNGIGLPLPLPIVELEFVNNVDLPVRKIAEQVCRVK